jgi:dihydrofolate reductase
MGRVVVINHVTLDGVMQGPGRPDEDTRDGFDLGGWAAPRNDEVMAAKVAEWMSGDHAFLFGRRSYEGMLDAWNRMGGPHKDGLNNVPKYVASRSSTTSLKRPNSTLLHGDVPAAVSGLKESLDTDLVVMGSGELIGTLMAAELIDAFLLMVHPLVLGTGRRLFTDGPHASLRLTDSVATTKGVLLATYEPSGTE